MLHLHTRGKMHWMPNNLVALPIHIPISQQNGKPRYQGITATAHPSCQNAAKLTTKMELFQPGGSFDA
jgi:hypothetical protein